MWPGRGHFCWEDCMSAVRLDLIQAVPQNYSNDRLTKKHLFVNYIYPRFCNPVSLGHMFWSCLSLVNFLTRKFECNTPLKPANFSEMPVETCATNLWSSLKAPRVILMNWKSDIQPTSEMDTGGAVIAPPQFRCNFKYICLSRCWWLCNCVSNYTPQ